MSERFIILHHLQDPRERAISTEDSGTPLFLYGASLSSTKELSTFQSSPFCSRGYQSVFLPPGARCPPEQPANRRIPNAAKRSLACFISSSFPSSSSDPREGYSVRMQIDSALPKKKASLSSVGHHHQDFRFLAVEGRGGRRREGVRQRGGLERRRDWTVRGVGRAFVSDVGFPTSSPEWRVPF